MSYTGLEQLMDMINPQNEDHDNQGRDTQPSAAAPTGLTSGNQTWGSWGEIEDSLATEALLTHIQINLNHVTVDEVITVQIGQGAAGSETARATFIVEVPLQNTSFTIPLPKPVRFAAATRIAGRCVGTTTNAMTVQVKLTFSTGFTDIGYGHGGRAGNIISALQKALLDPQRDGTYSTIPVPNATTGIVTPITHTAGNAYANPAYSEVVASNPADCIIDMVYLLESATVTTFFEIDIATGADGSETVHRTVPFKAIDANELQVVVLPVPLFVPSGARIAVRARGSANTAFDIVLGRRLGTIVAT